MKKIITLALALAFVTPIQAQASCGEGQASGIEINATTKQVTHYCFTPVIGPGIIPQTQQQAETTVQEKIAQTITSQKNENPVTVYESPITVEVTPIAEPLTKLEVNVATGQTTLKPLDEQEINRITNQRAADQAQQKAKEKALQLSLTTQGTKQCVPWSAGSLTGEECNLDPIPATEEEVAEEFEFLKDLFAFSWFNFLNLWGWNW